MGIGVALGAVALGATVIEKHFTLSRAEGGVDADFSLEPHELKILADESKKVWEALGRIKYDASEVEEKSKQFKRSIYFVKDLEMGSIITEEAIRCIRPGYGLSPKYYSKAIGKVVKKSVKKGERLEWDVIT